MMAGIVITAAQLLVLWRWSTKLKRQKVLDEKPVAKVSRISPNDLEARLALAIERRHEQSRLAYRIDPGMALARQHQGDRS
jgi:hypothetical protein